MSQEHAIHRFSQTSTSRHLRRLFLTALLALPAFALLAEPARAQESCGDIQDQPEAVLDDMLAALDPYFPIEDPRTCEKIVKVGVAACHEAISDAGSCLGGLGKSTLKALKSACATTVDPAACNDDAQEQLDAIEAGIESISGDAHGSCDTDFAPSLLDLCLGNPV